MSKVEWSALEGGDMEFIPVRCYKENRARVWREGGLRGERDFAVTRLLTTDVIANNSTCILNFHSCVPGMGDCSESGYVRIRGRNGGPLHGLWCVTKAKND